MYPIVVGIFGIAAAIGPIAASGSSTDPVTKFPIGQVLSGFLPIVALFAIPMTFKMAGGLMNNVGKAVTGRANKLASGVSGGQFAKDVKQGKIEKGLLRTADPNVSFRGARNLIMP